MINFFSKDSFTVGKLLSKCASWQHRCFEAPGLQVECTNRELESLSCGGHQADFRDGTRRYAFAEV